MRANVVGERIAVKIIDREDKTESGIILYRPDATDPDHAEVISVGDGTKTRKGQQIPSTFNVGDRVLVDKGIGIPMKIDGEEILILKEEEIIGFIND